MMWSLWRIWLLLKSSAWSKLSSQVPACTWISAHADAAKKRANTL